MTTGVPLYLVSACGSAEEFVAAFRRYADKTGLFVPCAAPLPAGRRGRLALALKDGGVMVEGEAEVLQSSTKASVLYGRPGMTIRFTAPDDFSKTVIAELEKARLAMKPAAPSVPPRPAEIPAEPRPAVPAVGGRIDAANALAECVVIGDPALLTDAKDGSSKSKFVVPSIPLGGPRAKTPSTAPDPQAGRPKSQTTPPDAANSSSSPAEPRSKSPTTPPDPSSLPLPLPANLPSSRMTSIGFPAIDKLPAFPAKAPFPAPDSPLLKTQQGVQPPTNPTQAMNTPSVGVDNDEPTTLGEAPSQKDTPTAFAAVPSKPEAPTSAGGPVMKVTAATTIPSNKDEPTSVGGPVMKVTAATAVPSNNDEPTTIGEIPDAKDTPTAFAAVPSKSDESTTFGTFPPRKDASRPAVPKGDEPTLPARNDTPTAFAAVPSKSDESTTFGTFPPRQADEPTPPAGKDTPTAFAAVPSSSDEPTSIGELPIVAPSSNDEPTAIGELPGDDAPHKATQPAPGPTPEAAAKTAPAAPRAPASTSASGKHKATSIGFPVLRLPHESSSDGLVPPAPAAKASEPSAPARGKNPTRPPLTPRHPTPVAPVPIVRWPAKAAPIVEDEQTEMTVPPSLAAAALADTGDRGPTYDDKVDPLATTQVAQRSGGMRASEILAAIPTEDWSMSPDAAAPTVLPTSPTTEQHGPEPAQPSAPSGDWTISNSEEGWSAPAKAEAVPPGSQQPASGNPIVAVSSDEPLTAVEWEEKPTGLGEAKIEIDPTLMQPLKPMPADDPAPPVSRRAGTEALAGVVSVASGLRSPSQPVPLVAPQGAPPPLVGSLAGPPSEPRSQPAATPVFAPAPMPPGIQAAPARPLPGVASPTPFPPAPMPPGIPPTPAPSFDPNAHAALFGVAPAPKRTDASPQSRKRTILLIAAAAAAVAASFVIVLVIAGGGNQGRPAVGSGSAADAAGSDAGGTTEPSGSGSAMVAVDPPVAIDAGVPEPVEPDAGGTCKVNITSVPAGAVILIAGDKRGTTPQELELPCGTETKLTLRKAKFGNTARTITPVAGKPNKLAVKLGRTIFTVKVTSTPPGATIRAGGRSMGVTPATIRLPGFETAQITLSKPGYATDTKSITPKSDNARHHATLKKGKR